MKCSFSFLTSISIHVFVGLVLWFGLKAPLPLASPTPITIEISERPESRGPSPEAGAQRPEARGRNRNQSQKQNSELRNFSLLPGLRFGPPASGRGAQAGISFGDAEWGEGGADFKHVESTSELQLLAHELDGAMSYPSVLGKREISGDILVRVFFRQEGGCNWTRTRIFPGEPHLRVYVLGLLKKVCGLGQIENLRFHTTDHVDVSFRFRLVNLGEAAMPVPPSFISGNVLGLERTWTRSVTRLNLGPITLFDGDLIHIDFDWLFNQWDRLVGDHKDPMDAFRD